MSEQKHMSRAELAAAAGVPEDAIVFWIRQGLLRSETTEPRKHHRYVLGEAKIAAVLGELREFGMNVVALRAAADHLRAALDAFEALPEPRWTVLAERVDGGMDPDEKEHCYLGSDLFNCEGYLQLERTPSGELRLTSAGSEPDMASRSAILVDLKQVLAPFAAQTVAYATEGSPADAGFEGAA